MLLLKHPDRLDLSHLSWEGRQKVWPSDRLQQSGLDEKKRNPCPDLKRNLASRAHLLLLSLGSSEARRLPGLFHLWLSLNIPTSPLNKPAAHQGPTDGCCWKMLHMPKGASCSDCEHMFQAEQDSQCQGKGNVEWNERACVCVRACVCACDPTGFVLSEMCAVVSSPHDSLNLKMLHWRSLQTEKRFLSLQMNL